MWDELWFWNIILKGRQHGISSFILLLRAGGAASLNTTCHRFKSRRPGAPDCLSLEVVGAVARRDTSRVLWVFVTLPVPLPARRLATAAGCDCDGAITSRYSIAAICDHRRAASVAILPLQGARTVSLTLSRTTPLTGRARHTGRRPDNSQGFLPRIGSVTRIQGAPCRCSRRRGRARALTTCAPVTAFKFFFRSSPRWASGLHLGRQTDRRCHGICELPRPGTPDCRD